MTTPATQQAEESQGKQDQIAETLDVVEETPINAETTTTESQEEQPATDQQTDPTGNTRKRRRPNNHS